MIILIIQVCRFSMKITRSSVCMWKIHMNDDILDGDYKI